MVVLLSTGLFLLFRLDIVNNKWGAIELFIDQSDQGKLKLKLSTILKDCKD